jgi:hypothetical protein
VETVVFLRCNHRELTGTERREECEHLGHQWTGIFKTIRGCAQGDDGDQKICEVLLTGERCVHCQERIVTGMSGLTEQRAVLYASPAEARNAGAGVPGQESLQPPVQVLVD